MNFSTANGIIVSQDGIYTYTLAHETGGRIMSKRLPKGFCANLISDSITKRKSEELIPFKFSKEALEGKRAIKVGLLCKNKKP